MERFGQGDNVLLGYRHPKSFENSENSRYSNSDMDFNDVFGGPPRRYSMQEMRMRYSFSETIESEEDNPVSSTRGDPWSGLNEKPVFGEESVNRRRYVNDDFFDDIFKGDESYGSPRRTDREPFGSAPGSCVLSPARPLPPTAEPFGTSIPAQFSLPAKLTTAMDSPVFASGNGSPEKNKDGISNGMTNPQTSKASFSKFLNRAINGKSEAKGDRQFYRQSPLSREVSLTSEESPYIIKSNEKDKGSKFKEDSESVDESQFHFSIYKWPGGGVPLMMPLRAGKSSKFEEKSKTERFSSSNGSSIECNNFDSERSEYDNMDSEAASANNHSVSSNAESKSLEVEREKDDKGNNQKGTESQATIKDANLEVLESKFPNGIKIPAVADKATLNNRTEELPSSHQAGIRDKLEKEVRTNVAQAAKREMKPLRALLSDNVDAQGNSNEEIESAVKGRAAKSVHISNKEKKNDARRKIPNKESVDKDSLPGSPITSGNTPGKTGVKGKVTEFVKIFNQEATRKTKINADTRSQSSRWKSTDNYGIDSEGNTTIHKMDEKVQSSKVDNTPKAFCKVDENPYKNSVKQPSNIKTSNHTSNRYTDQKDASSNPESFRGIYKATGGNSEDHFQESFSVEVLCQDQDKGLQTNVNREEIQASDAKIQQWSHGRKGNIRSLLSTLQYVLWPESGWKPVPLVNIIEGSGVKRAYQRALLCLHPDKLQQKDASFHQKYIAEKVFDILQEAWDHFNSLGGI